MSNNGHMPTDSTGPSMGSLQSRLALAGQTAGGEKPNIPLGQGGLAMEAARAYRENGNSFGS